MNAALTALKHSVRLIGFGKTVALIVQKRAKARALGTLSARLQVDKTLPAFQTAHAPGDGWVSKVNVSEGERVSILDQAEAMLIDESCFFTFPYHLRRQDDPWNFDPIQRAFWPRRHYTEQKLHAVDTPQDVKIVWEINRFKDLPTLAQAACMTNDLRFVNEALYRMSSWVESNPVAQTVNWASGLEIGIRLIAWSATLRLLQSVGLLERVPDDIAHSVWQQAMYLREELSLDNVVGSNNRIGEAAGLYVTASFWEYPDAREHRHTARQILEREILEQTFRDGSTRESTTWYHTFVTDFCSIVHRIAERANEPMSEEFRERLRAMHRFARAVRFGDSVQSNARIGDGDDGFALYFVGDPSPWLQSVFGYDSCMSDAIEPLAVFPEGGYATMRLAKSAAIVRAGPFGMGGDGFSSHAHDDCLSPVVTLNGMPVLVDRGTYVYNGNRSSRTTYRELASHNGLRIGATDHAEQKYNFGWKRVRRDATLLSATITASHHIVTASYGETLRVHRREFALGEHAFVVRDLFDLARLKRLTDRRIQWQFHLAPEWTFAAQSDREITFTNDISQLRVFVEGIACLQCGEYEYSPSYLMQERARVVRASSDDPADVVTFRFEVGTT